MPSSSLQQSSAIEPVDATPCGVTAMWLGLLRKMRLREAIDVLLPTEAELSHGEVIEALVLNRLTAPEPLYEVEGWARESGLAALTGRDPARFNPWRSAQGIPQVNARTQEMLRYLGVSGMEKAALKALNVTLSKVPQPARQAIFQRVPSPYGVTGVFAGETEAVHEQTLARCYEQYLVPVKGQADILVAGVPYISPYNVHAFLNPLLVSVMAQGYLFNLYRGMPMVKKGGTMIIFHPCTDKFDRDQHAPYIDFVHQLLPETRDAVTLHKKYEKKFGANPAMIQAYRTGHAYYPVHPFYMWYWGEPGRQHMGRVIVVGADNEYIPKLLGYETARSFPEAMEMAKDTAPPSPETMMIHAAPMLMTDMSI